MGCATSKQNRRDQCQRPYSPAASRSYLMQVHHPPQSHGDSYHVVALTSSTLGSLNVQIDDTINGNTSNFVSGDEDGKVEEFSIGLIEAKTWSDMINEKIPIRTPAGVPETINTWELMEGLEDVSPFRSSNLLQSFSFDVGKCEIPGSFVGRKSSWSENPLSSPKPTCLQTADGDLNSEENLPLENPFHLWPLENLKQKETDSDHLRNSKNQVVVYFTSLRGVRKTYEDCNNVKMILKNMGIRVDERDVSMHSGFKEELRELLAGINGGSLPRVFVEKKDIGGADEIRRLHEDGELEKLLELCEREEDERGGCEACGDIRFVPCKTCSGSCKVYNADGNSTDEEEEVETEEENEEDDDYGFKRCTDCNENGLIRCPICCH